MDIAVYFELHREIYKAECDLVEALLANTEDEAHHLRCAVERLDDVSRRIALFLPPDGSDASIGHTARGIGA